MKKINLEKGFTRTPKFGVTPKGGGFTLIELLVVVAIIGVLASVILVNSGDARNKGNDTAVKTNLATLRQVAEIFFLNNLNSYLPAGGVNVAGACPNYDPQGTNMLSKDKVIADALAEAIKRGNGSSCYNSANAWAVAVGLKLTLGTSWCVDTTGTAKMVNSVPAGAINSSSFTCN
ncbi:MAG: type II secretion system protein [Patescibacteria group bacterium]